jgi:hypothetical protein
MIPNHLLARLVAPELRAFRGEARLAPVFWLHGVVASLWLIGLNLLAIRDGDWKLVQALILVDLAYTAWILVAIWRCAANAHPSCGTLARWLTVAWGLNTLFVLLFIEIELVLERAAG